MTISTSITRRTVMARALVVGMLSVFSSSAWAVLPPAPMEVNPINPDNCVIYVTNQAGPFRQLKVMPGAEGDTYAANVCSEGDILPGQGTFNAPDPDDPSYLEFNTVALAAGGEIHLMKSNKVLETHTKDAASLIIDGNVLNPPPVATRFFDITGGSFPGPGVAFRKEDPSNDPNDDIACRNDAVHISPGKYRDLDVDNCDVHYDGPGDFIFRGLGSRNSDHFFNGTSADDNISVIAAEFVSFGHTDNVNSAREPNVTFFIDGFDGAGGSLNQNSNSSVTGAKKAFEFGGDGDFNTCHVYAKNGTMGMKGVVRTHSRFLGENFEFNGGPFVTVIHPQEICDPSNPVLTVQKSLIPPDDPGLFVMDADGTPGDEGGDGATSTAQVTVGDQASFSETAGTDTNLDDYDTSWSCSNGLSGDGPDGDTFEMPDANVTCTFTNTRKVLPDNPLLTVQKSLIPSNDPGLFVMDANGTPGDEGGNGATSTAQVTVGDQASFSETAGTDTNLDDYDTSWSCSNDLSGDGPDGDTFEMPDANVTCTFTNMRKVLPGNPLLTVQKRLIPSNDPGLFVMDANGTPGDEGGNGATSTAQVTVGDQASFSETAGTDTSLDDYDTSWSCSNGLSGDGPDGDTFEMPDANVTCTFTNTRKIPDIVTDIPTLGEWGLILLTGLLGLLMVMPGLRRSH